MNQEVKYENRLVAFIDILGFSEIIKQSKDNPDKVNLIYSVLNYLKDWETSKNWDLKLIEIEEDAQKKGVDNFDIAGKTNSTSFSDSIVVSVKVDDNVNEMTSTLIANLAYIGAILIEQGILFRGGLTMGNIIHNEFGTVFGQGLIEAYSLESNSAKYPRIILSDRLIKQLNYPLETKGNRYPYHQYIKRFDDGCVGIHQMTYYQVVQNSTLITQEKLLESLCKVRRVIIAGLDLSFERTQVYEKYQWLADRYERLVILDDIDFKTNKKIKLKFKLQNIQGADSEHNIHFSYIDKLYEQLGEE